jgi:hypothetical protein
MLHSLYYPISAIQDEARHLLESGRLKRTQPIHTLGRFFRDREWCQIERELADNQYLLRDRICDLVSHECWQDD